MMRRWGIWMHTERATHNEYLSNILIAPNVILSDCYIIVSYQFIINIANMYWLLLFLIHFVVSEIWYHVRRFGARGS